MELSEAEFREAMRLGLGRAILYVKMHDVSAWREAVLDACQHCYSYDVQIEGTRAMYMSDLVASLPDREFYEGAVLESLGACGDDWDAVQRFAFAYCLAVEGNEDAKRAMYAAYQPGPRMGEDIAVYFLRMDGTKGLLFVAEKLGELIAQNANKLDFGFFLDQSAERLGEEATWRELQEAGRSNARIERYRIFAEDKRRAWREGAEQRVDFEVSGRPYEALFDKAPARHAYLYTRWGEQATVSELEKAAHGLMAAADTEIRKLHLRIFWRRAFPLDPSVLFRLAASEDKRIQSGAVKALTNVVDTAVREFAVRLVETREPMRRESISLIAQNFSPGDHAMALRWFAAEEDGWVKHSMGSDLLSLWKRHPDVEREVTMLLAVYEHVPCSFCRLGAVERLLELGALADELRAECGWDANDEIRDLVAGERAEPTSPAAKRSRRSTRSC